MKMKGKFLTLEGIEGVGKSTHAKFIQTYLIEKNIQAVATHEPGGTPMANAIRNLLLTKTFDANEQISQNAELLLMFAARAQHIANVIEPNLKQGAWIVCDRFTDASYAYQGYGRGLAIDRIATLETWVQNDLQPQITFLFDAPVAVALQRVQKRGQPDRIESETLEFFQRVREGYLARASLFPERFHIIDATVSLEEVQKQIKKILDKFISNQLYA
jgi:dTMP kinase